MIANSHYSDYGNSDRILVNGDKKIFRRYVTMMTTEKKKEIIAAYGRTPDDTGSPFKNLTFPIYIIPSFPSATSIGSNIA